MSVKTYSLKKDGDKKLSANFSVREFRCNDGSDTILISPETVAILQAVRDYFGKPVTINSAYRTPAYNKKVGGASASQHVKGTACDIVVSGVPASAVAAFLEAKYPKNGIGQYSTFTHIDTRGWKSYWKNSGSNVVSSFKLGNIYETYKAKPAAAAPVKPAEQEDEEEMTRYNKVSELPEYYRAEIQELIDSGALKGDANGDLNITEDMARAMIISKRYADSVKK